MFSNFDFVDIINVCYLGCLGRPGQMRDAIFLVRNQHRLMMEHFLPCVK